MNTGKGFFKKYIIIIIIIIIIIRAFLCQILVSALWELRGSAKYCLGKTAMK